MFTFNYSTYISNIKSFFAEISIYISHLNEPLYHDHKRYRIKNVFWILLFLVFFCLILSSARTQSLETLRERVKSHTDIGTQLLYRRIWANCKYEDINVLTDIKTRETSKKYNTLCLAHNMGLHHFESDFKIYQEANHHKDEALLKTIPLYINTSGMYFVPKSGAMICVSN